MTSASLKLRSELLLRVGLDYSDGLLSHQDPSRYLSIRRVRGAGHEKKKPQIIIIRNKRQEGRWVKRKWKQGQRERTTLSSRYHGAICSPTSPPVWDTVSKEGYREEGALGQEAFSPIRQGHPAKLSHVPQTFFEPQFFTVRTQAKRRESFPFAN